MGSLGAISCRWCPSLLLGKVTLVRHINSQSSKKWLERQSKDPYVKRAQKLGLPSRASFKLQEIDQDHFAALLKKEKKGRGDTPNHRKRKRLIQPNMLVLDLGAAPGGWSLYASSVLKPSLGGALVAVDLLPLDETLRSNYSDISSRIRSNLQSNFQFIQGDFTHNNTQIQIMESFSCMTSATNTDSTAEDETKEFDEHCRPPDLILSDMAQNFSGDSLTDALQTMGLCEQALAFAAGNDCFDPSYSAKDGKGMLAVGGAFLCKYFLCGRDNEADLMEAARRAFRSVHTIKPKASRKESSEMYLLALDFGCK